MADLEQVQGGDVPLPHRQPGQERRRRWTQRLHRPGLHHLREPDHPPTGEGHPADLPALIARRAGRRGCDDPACRSRCATGNRRNPARPQPLTRISIRELDRSPTSERVDRDEQPDRWVETDLDAMKKLKSAFDNIKQQLSRVIVGQDQVIEELLIALFARGHCMLEGVPGLAKTLMISTLAQVPVAGLQPHPVHPRPDAVGHHRHRRHRGEPRDRPPRVQVPARARCSPT